MLPTDMPPTPPVRAVAFDLDDTLLDHVGAARVAIRVWLEQRGAVPGDDIDDVWMALEHEHFGAHHAGRITFEEQRRRRIAGVMRHVGMDVPAEDALDVLFVDYLSVYARGWSAFGDALVTIKRLREAGMLIGMLTNGNRAQQEDKLRRIGLADEFDVLLYSGDLPAMKPSPLAFAVLAGALGVPVESVVYVGDRIDTDVTGALAAGMRAFWLDRSGTEPPAALPSEATRITSLADLAGVLGVTR